MRRAVSTMPRGILLNMVVALLLYAQNVLLSLSTQLAQAPEFSSLPSPPSPSPTRQTKNERIPIFYNLFVKEQADFPRVRALVEEQLSYIRPGTNHPIYYNSIGIFMEIPNATLLEHHATGSEAITLFSLWSYCKKNLNDKVIYMHSKGSLSNTPENEKLRRFLTRAALSDECRNIPSTCNVCSSRFSPFPHPHTSGNMFLARCEYIQQLIDPNTTRRKMARIDRYPNERDFCKGRRRFALEHWIHSSPRVKPCDLHAKPNYFWGNDGLLELDSLEIDLQPAPRFNMSVFETDSLKATMVEYCKPGRGRTLQERLDEYTILYGDKNNGGIPDETWWGWKFYPNELHLDT